MDPPTSSQRRLARVTRSSAQKKVEKSKEALKDKLSQDRRRVVVRLEKLDFGEGSGSDESQSSTETEILGSVDGGHGSQWFPEHTEPVPRRSRGRPPKRLNNGRTPARQQPRRRNEASGSRERVSWGEPSSSSRRLSGGVKRKSESMSSEFEIEDILDKYVDRDGNTWYLILWKNYEKFESTWEPRGRLEPGGVEAIEDFENRAQQAVVLGEEGLREANVATGDIGDNAGSPPRHSQTRKSFRNILWQTSVDFMYSVITTSVSLIGIMTIFAYSYAMLFSQDD